MPGRPARIIAKMNQVEDVELSLALADASQAGVPIDLIVRGFCCLRPGVADYTENVRVRSIIGRFLEHSRIFHFANGHDDPLEGEFYIGFSRLDVPESVAARRSGHPRRRSVLRVVSYGKSSTPRSRIPGRRGSSSPAGSTGSDSRQKVPAARRASACTRGSWT